MKVVKIPKTFEKSTPKLNFTYHKAKRLGLALECLCLALEYLPKGSEAWGLVCMKICEIRGVNSTTKYCIVRKSTGHSFRIDVMAGQRPPGSYKNWLGPGCECAFAELICSFGANFQRKTPILKVYDLLTDANCHWVAVPEERDVH
jgi:hypothetical protein